LGSNLNLDCGLVFRAVHLPDDQLHLLRVAWLQLLELLAVCNKQKIRKFSIGLNLTVFCVNNYFNKKFELKVEKTICLYKMTTCKEETENVNKMQKHSNTAVTAYQVVDLDNQISLCLTELEIFGIRIKN
jgi:hypothetical protein